MIANDIPPEHCEWRWLGIGLGWGQITYCHAEESCPEPGYAGTVIGQAAYTLCMVGGDYESVEGKKPKRRK